MKLTISNEDFDEESLKVGDVLWYVNDDLQNPTEDAHPHIIIGIEDKIAYTVCGTSQEETILRKIKNLKLPDYSLFPALRPNSKNGLKKDTFIDCTVYFSIDFWCLQDKFQGGEVVKNSHRITLSEFEQIKIALLANKTTDIRDLIEYPSDEEE
jgi:hypothetical protein